MNNRAPQPGAITNRPQNTAITHSTSANPHVRPINPQVVPIDILNPQTRGVIRNPATILTRTVVTHPETTNPAPRPRFLSAPQPTSVPPRPIPPIQARYSNVSQQATVPPRPIPISQNSAAVVSASVPNPQRFTLYQVRRPLAPVRAPTFNNAALAPLQMNFPPGTTIRMIRNNEAMRAAIVPSVRANIPNTQSRIPVRYPTTTTGQPNIHIQNRKLIIKVPPSS